MASLLNKLFMGNAAWDSDNLPHTLKGIQNSNREASAIHSLNDKGYSRVHRDIARAMFQFIGNTGVIDTYLYGKFAVVKVSENLYVAERELADNSHEMVAYYTNGNVLAAKISSTGRYTPFDTLGGSGDIDVSTFTLALLAALMDVDSTVKDRMNKSLLDDNDFFYVSNAMYYHVNKDEGDLIVTIPNDGNVDMIQKTVVTNGAYNGEVIAGTPEILSGNSGVKKSKKKVLNMKQAKKEFLAYANSRAWTDEEKLLIPSFPDDFPIPQEAIKIARRFIDTRNDKRPMCNFMWRGITSYGKSTGVEAIACMLNVPLVRMTCHSNMETQQFLSDFVPDTSSGVSSSDLPDFETMQYDPEGAYYTLTGIEDENATPDMCLKAYGEAIAKQNTSTPRFKHVESNYVKALRRGYIVEIQECSRIKDSGVLVGLNEYDRAGAVIPLIDGSYTRRDANAMVIYTDNVGYASCRPIDPSVLRRMAFIIDSYEMPKDDVVNRVVYNTKADKDTVETLYDIWREIKEYAKERDISEGDISVTELEMLAQLMKYDGVKSLRDDVIECIISKASSDIEEQEELIAFIDSNKGRWSIL